jgi:hypothetical protein
VVVSMHEHLGSHALRQGVQQFEAVGVVERPQRLLMWCPRITLDNDQVTPYDSHPRQSAGPRPMVSAYVWFGDGNRVNEIKDLACPGAGSVVVSAYGTLQHSASRPAESAR